LVAVVVHHQITAVLAVVVRLRLVPGKHFLVSHPSSRVQVVPPEVKHSAVRKVELAQLPQRD
jgi:hypothetical protein